MSRELAKISQKRAKVSFGGPGSITLGVLGAIRVLEVYTGYFHAFDP